MGGFWQFFGLPDPAEGQRTEAAPCQWCSLLPARRRTDAHATT